MQWALADRFPALDRKGLYYQAPKPGRMWDDRERSAKLSPVDQVLVAMVGMVLVAAGAFGLFVGGCVLWLIFTG